MNEDSTIQPIIIILLIYKVMAVFKLERKQTAGFGEIYTFRLTMHIDKMSNHYGDENGEQKLLTLPWISYADLFHSDFDTKTDFLNLVNVD